jgi:hypothetical protein
MYDFVGAIIGIGLIAGLCAPVALAIYLWISADQ